MEINFREKKLGKILQTKIKRNQKNNIKVEGENNQEKSHGKWQKEKRKLSTARTTKSGIVTGDSILTRKSKKGLSKKQNIFVKTFLVPPVKTILETLNDVME